MSPYGEEMEIDGEVMDERGDLLVRGIMEPGLASRIDVRIVNTEVTTYRTIDVDKVFQSPEKEKRDDT